MIDRTTKSWLLAGGFLLLALGLFVIPISVEGARGPTRLVGTLSHAWEVLAAVTAVALVVGMARITRLLPGAPAVRILAVATALLLAANTTVAALRFTGRVAVELPLAWWVPGTFLLYAWAWVAGGAAHRDGYIGPRLAKSIRVIVVAEVALVGASLVALLSTTDESPVVNVLAGLASGALWVAFAAWWVTVALRWRPAG